jgi:hypothetical protein
MTDNFKVHNFCKGIILPFAEYLAVPLFYTTGIGKRERCWEFWLEDLSEDSHMENKNGILIQQYENGS